MFQFNYAKLESIGYVVTVDAKNGTVTVDVSGAAPEMLDHDTYKRIYADIENNTSLTCTQAENAVRDFLDVMQSQHIWNIATNNKWEK